MRPTRFTQLAQFAALAAMASFGLSGCRFGNYEVDPPGPGAIQGNYESLLNSQMTICAAKTVTGANGTSQQQTNCAPIASNSLSPNSSAYFLFNQTDPSLQNQTMSDPVFLAFDSTSGLFMLEPPGNPNPGFFFIVESDNDGNLQNPGISYSPFSHLMPDTHPNCDLNMNYTASGTYGQPNGPFMTNTKLPLSGRIAINYDTIFTTNGNDCSQLEACYNGAAGCDATDNEIVQAEFGSFIKAGVMSVTDIPNIVDLSSKFLINKKMW